ILRQKSLFAYAFAIVLLAGIGSYFLWAKPLPPSAPQPTHTAVASTLTPSPSKTPTKKITQTSTPVHTELIFEEDFSQDKLGWKNQNSVKNIDQTGLTLEMLEDKNLREWMGTISTPRKTIKIDGDCTFQVKLSNKVRFSGVLFYPDTSEYYAFIIGSGERKDWPPGYASLGLLRPSLGDKAWDHLGDIEYLISSINDEITLKVVFVDDEAQVYVNGKFIARRNNEIFKAAKTFGGFYVVNGDKFTVKEIKVWGNPGDILQLQ
ncbi:MAG: hypothetical protein JXB49_05055, partial [Bacteroidales bacterium]|nr:hypothetical protein [Bacteroidales bacterium]